MNIRGSFPKSPTGVTLLPAGASQELARHIAFSSWALQASSGFVARCDSGGLRWNERPGVGIVFLFCIFKG
jgi:hypothetical protein